MAILPIYSAIKNKLFPTEKTGIEGILEQGFDIENLDERRHLEDLYMDPDFQKQMSMGDIEFEMDMYDDIMYGQPAMERYPGASSDLKELDSILGTQVGDIDELALAGLRGWALNPDPLKYTDPTPYDLRLKKDGEDFGIFQESMADQEGPVWGYYGANFGNRIDLNLPRILQGYPTEEDVLNKKRMENFDPYELNRRVSDVFRHEYKHNPWVINNMEEYSHPAIYGTNARFGLSRGMAKDSLVGFKDPSTYEQNPFHSRNVHQEAYSADRAGDYARENIDRVKTIDFRNEPIQAKDRPPSHHFSTGVIVSLVI